MHKNTFISRLVACSFAVVLACGMVPTAALAQPEGESTLTPLVSVEEQMARLSGYTGQGLIPSVVDPSYYDFPEGYAGISPRAALPPKFDLRDVEGKNCVTPVKMQSPWGSCWAFAATSTLESNILNQGVGTAATTDFSERHLAWFYNHPLPLTAQNSQAGEGNYLIDPNGDAIMGASGSAAWSLLSAGFGVESEAAVPYKNDEGIRDPKNPDICYAKSGTWAVGEDKRFDSLHQLKESNMLPGTAQITMIDGTPSYTYNPAATEAMKNAIMKTGGINIFYAADKSNPLSPSKDDFINYKTWAQYTDKPLPADHAVAVVGWDDNYPVTKFKDGKQPPEPGAWIVKNSWGAVSNEFPNKHAWGIDGYFYLSYYDQTVVESSTYDLTKDETEAYGITHQYDYLAKASMIDGTFTDKKEAGVANVFTAQSDQTLKAVSVRTPVAGTKATISVYKLNAGATSPVDGELLGTTEAAFDFAGYHRAPLDPANANTTYNIRAGEKFSVVEQIKAGDTYYYAFERGISEEGAKGIKLPIACNAVVNPGESYLLDGGVWTDAAVTLADPNLTSGGNLPYGNAMIKAFADKAELPPVSEITVATVEGSGVTTIPVQTTQKTEVVGNLFVGANPSIVLSDLAVGSPVPELFNGALAAGDTLLFSYDVAFRDITGCKGPFKMTLPVGDAYNGKPVKMLHLVSAGSLDKNGTPVADATVDVYDGLTVKEGMVTLAAYSLSPFGVALAAPPVPPTPPTPPAPITPDTTNQVAQPLNTSAANLAPTGDALPVGLVVLAVVGVCAGLALLIVAGIRKRGNWSQK